MEQILSGIISGVVANTITAFCSYAWTKKPQASAEKEKPPKTLESDPSLVSIFRSAEVALAASGLVATKRNAEKLRGILVSPEVDAIVRQIYATELADGAATHLESIRDEFLTLLSLRLGEAEGTLAPFGTQLFEALVKTCQRALTIAIDRGTLSAHEAKSGFRHRLVMDELAAIKKNLDFLKLVPDLNTTGVLAFEQKFRQQVGRRHGHITPPHFDSVRKIPIDKLYVSPDFIRLPLNKGDESLTLSLKQFLPVIYRVVLLGNPGGGKSNFALKLSHELSTNYSNRVLGGRQLTPILVVLREFGAEKKARNVSILQFIEAIANATYQISPPRHAFEYLLLNGRTLVIFDGLDELLDTSYRQQISADVESFCHLYPSVPVIVTSRKVGYEQAPLDETMFETFYLSDFNEAQVREYAFKWVATDKDLSAKEQKQKTERFLHESRVVLDLRSNPLMLALMCNIYRGENYIPRNRPDVYEKCATMLFERWDKSRGIHVPLPFEFHIRPAMMFLANWVYTSEALSGGVTERSLIDRTTEYLCPKRFEDRDDAEKAAREFIEFCRGRAWVFTDTGTTKDGERLYQFTHRTFLEYFTAAHLVRTHATPDRLIEILLPRIAKREMDVVSQLAFQPQNKNVEGAGDELLEGTLQSASTGKPNERNNLVSFAARCLEFMIPSPKLTRTIASTCLNQCLEWSSIGPRRRLGKTHNFAGTNGSNNESSRAFEIAFNLLMAQHRGERRVLDGESIEFWDAVKSTYYLGMF